MQPEDNLFGPSPSAGDSPRVQSSEEDDQAWFLFSVRDFGRARALRATERLLPGQRCLHNSVRKVGHQHPMSVKRALSQSISWLYLNSSYSSSYSRRSTNSNPTTPSRAERGVTSTHPPTGLINDFNRLCLVNSRLVVHLDHIALNNLPVVNSCCHPDLAPPAAAVVAHLIKVSLAIAAIATRGKGFA